jgi:hypothetical protein
LISLPYYIKSLFPIEIPFSTVHKLNGIFGWFALKKLNLSTFVELIPSSTYDGSIQNILDDSRSYWWSKKEINSNFEIKFKNSLISLSGYSLFLSRWWVPKSWIIEGLNEQNQWIEIDKKSNLEVKSEDDCFWHHISCFKSVFCSSIRFTQIDVNSYGDHCLLICTLDFYGSFKLIS